MRRHELRLLLHVPTVFLLLQPLLLVGLIGFPLPALLVGPILLLLILLALIVKLLNAPANGVVAAVVLRRSAISRLNVSVVLGINRSVGNGKQ